MKQKLLSKILAATLVAQSIFSLWGAMPVAAAGEEIPIDEVHFPDPGFRSVIAQNYDTDHNGTLNDQERGVYNVYCKNYPNVYSIEGIEYFPEVRGVWCENCSITGKLDFTKNPEITGIWCSGNPITEIDLSGNPKLEWIYCFQCDLTELDLSHNPKMGYLEISENPKLTSIDLSVCPDLEHLIIFGCPLESLDLSNNTKLSHLDAQNTGLKHLDLGNNPNMKRLDVWGNHGLEVDVSGLPGLEFFNCADMGLTHLDVSHNPQLMALICDWNNIAELDLSHNPRLCDLRCGCNELTSLDISHNPLLYYFQIFGNPISSVNINNNSRLRYILDQVEKGNGTMVYDPGSQSNDYTVDFGGDHEYMDELMYFISVKPSTQLIADNPNEAADVHEIYLNTKDGLSDSEDFVTRGEAIQTMYELAGSPAVSGSSRFTDVAGTFYEKAVIWGEQNHICYGYPNLCSDTFNGDMAIARQDFALMVHHYAEGKKWLSAFDYGRTDDKADFFEVDYYCWGAVTYAIQWEILETKSNHIYPHGRITTVEMENGLKEFLDHCEKRGTINVSTAGGKGNFENTGYIPVIPTTVPTTAPTTSPEPTNVVAPTTVPTPTTKPTPTTAPTLAPVDPKNPSVAKIPSLDEYVEGVVFPEDPDHMIKAETDRNGNLQSAKVYDASGKTVDTASGSFLRNIRLTGRDGKEYAYTLLFTDGEWNQGYDSKERGAFSYKGNEYFIAGGVVNQLANGLLYTGDAAGWKFLAAGRVVKDQAGLVMYQDQWFWIDKNGSCDQDYEAIVNWNGGRFLVHGGRLRTDYTGYSYDPQSRNDWYYITNGQVWGDGTITDRSIDGVRRTARVRGGVVSGEWING
ncbi:MAG: hypothetical protein J6O73_18960 [Lachnospiraceae bacterium]|nr:hypothetical protein [Lachnospiraceae bacterium]MBO6208986.1 hypothetical protein [Lachnospiraceae bacterium]